MEFDKSKILTVVTADQLKEGQMGWINDCVDYLKSDIKNISPYKVFRTNENMCFDFPFAAEGRGVRRYFYPAPEPTYADRQAQWVKENNVEEGTKVRVTRAFTENEDGSRCREHDDLVGMTGVVSEYGIGSHYLAVDMSDGSMIAVPYFALEVIKEPTYRPFASAEEFKPYRDDWLTIDGSFFKPYGYNDVGLLVENTQLTWKYVFDTYMFENGTPCGVKI